MPEQKFSIVAGRFAYEVIESSGHFLVTAVNMESFKGVVGVITGFTTDNSPASVVQPYSSLRQIMHAWNTTLRGKVRAQFVLVRLDRLQDAASTYVDPASAVLTPVIETISAVVPNDPRTFARVMKIPDAFRRAS